jgi:hypothetical protein
MARYRITLEFDAVNQDDAVHRAYFLAGWISDESEIDVVSVVRHVEIGFGEDVDHPVIRADARRGIRLGRPQRPQAQ